MNNIEGTVTIHDGIATTEDGTQIKLQSREEIVLSVAGEIFGAIKQHGLLSADDLAAWVSDQGLHHHLYQLAYPEVNEEGDDACPPEDATDEQTEAASMNYARGLDEFEGELMHIIDPDNDFDDED